MVVVPPRDPWYACDMRTQVHGAGTDSMSPGMFVVSLDLELLWGMFDVATKERYGARILGEHTVIPRMLDLFTRYGIHATWAVVGMLAAPDRVSLARLLPAIRPRYDHVQFSSYGHLESGVVGVDETDDPYHFGASLVARIREVPNQEVACHTFSHYYCLEEGAGADCFRADLVAWERALGERARSIVFPRNQYDTAHLAVCAEAGIRAFRGTEESGWYATVSTDGQYRLYKRLVRLVDSYLNVTGHHTYPLAEVLRITPRNVASSRFLRPYTRLPFLERRKVSRVLRSIDHAAARGEVYHLWWHPHNMGIDQDENLASLERICAHVAALRDQGRLVCCTMEEVAERAAHTLH